MRILIETSLRAPVVRGCGAMGGSLPGVFQAVLSKLLPLILCGIPAVVITASAAEQKAGAPHWAFQPLKAAAVPEGNAKEPVDRFVARELKKEGLHLSAEADRATLIRRVAFILTGLPPTVEEIEEFSSDLKGDGYERMVSRYLDSPRFGERWGKVWLDAAGYADSNGYFDSDSDRPLAWRYRDYVVRSFNRDKPFDQFVREQIAGDELSGWTPDKPATPEIIELLEATHYLRNAQDGSGESDGNPDEVRTDRYHALESQMQIMGSSLLGLTLQCAKCHDHKFEPLTQRDYYSFQAFLYPSYNIDKWTKPQDRIVQASLPSELEASQAADKKLDAELSGLKKEFTKWVAANRVRGKALFMDTFDAASLRAHWSNSARGDKASGGSPAAVNPDSDQTPGGLAKDGKLHIVGSEESGDRWISTVQSFRWKPATKGEWIQATFDLVATKLDAKGKDAERVAYFIAKHDSDHTNIAGGGKILVDGNPGGASGVKAGRPAKGTKSLGEFAVPYKAGQNYGVRVTRTGDDKFAVEHVVDGEVDGKALELKGDELPDGSFGFGCGGGRSFIVDNVLIESSNSSDPEWTKANETFQRTLAEKKKVLEKSTKELASRRGPKPGRIAWMSDAGPTPPEVRLLKRGNHKTPGELVEPAFPAFFKQNSEPLKIQAGSIGTGRRLAWARWITEPGSVQAALLARVTVNRIWQNCFGTGIVSTSDNLGVSGSKPTHPELLEFLASGFVRDGWKQKALLKSILCSATFRQHSLPDREGIARDPSDRLLWRFPLKRLDAEAIRDAMLAASGRMDSKAGGPYVPTSRSGDSEILVDESKPGAFARSIFLQHRRTHVPTFLAVFDAPSIVFNCAHRAQTTMPLQSLGLLNSDFAVNRAEDLARRLKRECGADEAARIDRAFLLVAGRKPDTTERKLAAEFLVTQNAAYAGKPEAGERAWADFCQSLFASSNFLYLQ